MYNEVWAGFISFRQSTSSDFSSVFWDGKPCQRCLCCLGLTITQEADESEALYDLKSDKPERYTALFR